MVVVWRTRVLTPRRQSRHGLCQDGMVHHFLQLHLALRHVGSERVSLREPLLLVDVRHSSAVSRPTSKTMGVEHVDPDLVVLWLEMAAWQTAVSCTFIMSMPQGKKRARSKNPCVTKRLPWGHLHRRDQRIPPITQK